MNRKIQIFVSYSHELSDNKENGNWVEINGKSLLSKIIAPIANVAETWTDARLNYGDEWDKVIERKIRCANIIILLLSPGYFMSKYIMKRELPMIMEEYNNRADTNNKLHIIPINIYNPFTKIKETYEWLSKIQAVTNPTTSFSELDSRNKDNIIKETEETLKSIVENIKSARIEETRRNANQYQFDDHEEKERLKKQTKILKKYDLPIFKSILRGKTDCTLLDIGCNNGYNIRQFFEDDKNIKYVVGVDKVHELIERANRENNNGKFIFKCLDCTSETFIKDLHEQTGYDKFDIIHISMVLLHLEKEKAQKLLKDLYELLNDNGIIIIRDIDDSLKLAYPDNDKLFEEMFKIDDYDGCSGYRKSGREIYSYLHNAGYNNIKLHRKGLDTVEVNNDDKDDLFKVCFSYIRPDLERMCEAYPSNKFWEERRDWVSKHYYQLEKTFGADEFFFQIGFMLYTATK